MAAKQQYDLCQPVWRPEEAGGVEDAADEQTWWSWDDLFSMVNRWKYWLAAIALPTALGGVSWLARVAGLASGCRTDARLGGVGLTSTLLSLFCHSYQQGRKQAEERRQAIPEVNLRMQFLQQVKEEEKEMRMKREREFIVLKRMYKGTRWHAYISLRSKLKMTTKLYHPYPF